MRQKLASLLYASIAFLVIGVRLWTGLTRCGSRTNPDSDGCRRHRSGRRRAHRAARRGFLSFFTSGQVSEILVKEGDLVKAGDVVARLGNRAEIEASMANARPRAAGCSAGAITTRGMKESEMIQVAGFITRVLNEVGNKVILKRIRKEVRDFCRGFPLFPG